MKQFRELFFLVVALLLSFSVSAQRECYIADQDGDGVPECSTDPDCQYDSSIERGCNCVDGIDNDGDGNIDVQDTDCADFYGLEFIGEDTDCSVPPPPGTDTWEIEETATVSGQNTVDTQSKMAIGDMDCDGISDVVATSKWNQQIRVIATTDGQADGSDAGDIKADYKTPGKSIFPGGNYYFELELTSADVVGAGGSCGSDCMGEMYSIVSKRKTVNSEPDGYYLVGFTYSPGELTPLFDAVYLGEDRPGIIGIADFDADGCGEIYIKDRIYAAESGELLYDGGGDWDLEVNSAPAAIDIIPGGNLELISGGIIYTVPDLSSRTEQPAQVYADINDIADPKYFPKVIFDPDEYGETNYSSTSVADMNGDGFVDVVLSGAMDSTDGPTAIFFWDVQNNVVTSFALPDPVYENGWPWGASRPNLADIDGDGEMEITVIAGDQLFALEVDQSTGELSIKWQKTVNDSRSGIVSTTVYDFDNDGIMEVVYRDAQELAIVSGADGTTLWSTTCQSHTMTEGPIIADINNDGGTDLVVPCFRGPGGFDINDPIQQQALGEIRIFNSQENAWLPTRRVYNQAGYHVTNINDDLTLPAPMLDMTTVFGTEPCANGVPGPIRPYNTFLNQVPTLGANGCPIYPGPDVAFVGCDPNLSEAEGGCPSDTTSADYFPAVEVIPPICGNLGIKVLFNIINNGARIITGDLPVSFWDGNPTTDSTGVIADLLHTTTLSFVDFQIGDTASFETTFNSTGKEFDLYVVLNDDGSKTPPFDLEAEECRLANNIYKFHVVPDPFEVAIEIVSHNEKCQDEPDNGELRAQIFEDGVETFDYSKYAFQWYSDSTGTTEITDAEGTTNRLTGRPEGPYSLIVTNTEKGCQSNVIDTTLQRLGATIGPRINILQIQDQCSPLNGELEAVDTLGNTGVTYTWYKDDLFNPLGITGPVASSLISGTYLVEAEKDGCTAVAQTFLPGPTFPDMNGSATQHITDCNLLNDGEALAQPLYDGNTQDPGNFTFDWFEYDTASNSIGSPLDPSYGDDSVVVGLPAGFYAVQATDLTTNCESAIDTLHIKDLRTYPEVQITEIRPQRSCDPDLPNGVLGADALIGGVVQDPANYTFEWFEGENTLPANAHTATSGVNGRIAEEIKGGGIPYTVKITNQYNCFSTLADTVSQQDEEPVLTLTKLNNSVCDTTLSSIPYNGEVTATVTYQGDTVTDFSAFSFEWYDGGDPNNDPLLADTDEVLNNVPGGTYTGIATLDSLYCSSLPVSIYVEDTLILPDIVVDITPNTKCVDPGNGILDAAVDEGGSLTTDPAKYSFEWRRDSDNNLESSTNVATDLNGGTDYTVEVINLITGCLSTSTQTVPDNSELPTVTLTKTDNTVCDDTRDGVEYTGTVTATVHYKGNSYIYTSDDMSGATFAWTRVSDGATMTSTNADDGFLEQLNGDEYSVQVTLDSLECTSLPVSTTVNNIPTLPVLDVAITPNTQCQGGDNGRANAQVDEGGTLTADPAKYEFEWFDDSGTSIFTTNLATGLAGNTDYTVEVEELATGCVTTMTVTIPDSAIAPVVSLTTTPNTICDNTLGIDYNGTVTATIDWLGQTYTTGDDFSGVTFAWEDDASNSIDNSASPDKNILINRDGGQYFVEITIDSVQCISQPVSANVSDSLELPVIDVLITPETTCSIDPTGFPNGELEAMVDTTGGFTQDQTLYSFEWFDDATSTSITTSPIAEDLNGDNQYSVIVVDQENGCENSKTVNLPDESEIPVVELTSTVNTVCDTTGLGIEYTGTITANVTYKGVTYNLNDPSPALSDMSGADFTWEDSGGNEITSTDSEDGFLENLGPDTYSVTVFLDSVGCESLPVTIEVKDSLTNPAVVISKVPDTSCDPSQPNGILSALVDHDGDGIYDNNDPLRYQITWYEGNTVNDPEVLTTTPTYGEVDQLLGNQTFTVEVLDLTTGCVSIVSEFLEKDLNIPDIAISEANVFNDCNAPNGELEVEAIPNGSPSDSGYVFYWYYGETTQRSVIDANLDATLTTDPGVVIDTLKGLEPGIYSVYGENRMTHCVTEVVSYEILVPEINMDIIVDKIPSACAQSTGVLKGVVNDPGTFTFEWYSELPENGDNTFFDDPPPSWPPDSLFQTDMGLLGDPANPDTSEVDTLSTGYYSLVVTDQATGCRDFRTIYLPFVDQHEIATTITPSTQCDSTAGDGEIFVQITSTPVGFSESDYWIRLWEGGDYSSTGTQIGSDSTGVAFPGGRTYSNLDPGTYTVEVQEDFGDSCSVYSFETIIIGVEDPVLTASTKSNTFCGSPGNGEITIQADPEAGDYWSDSLGNAYTYDFVWLSAPGTLPDDEFGIAEGTPVTWDSLDIGDYTVQVTAVESGCSILKDFTIFDEPLVPVTTDHNFDAQDLCIPSGRIQVTEITYDGNQWTPADINEWSEFEFRWYTSQTDMNNDVPIEEPPGSPISDDFLDNTNYSAMGEGTFYVKAIKVNSNFLDGGVGCETPPIEVAIADESENPTLTLSSTSNSVCDLSGNPGDGTITATASTEGPYSGSDYEWWVRNSADDTVATVAPGGNATQTFTALDPDIYTVIVQNDLNSCTYSADIEVPDKPVYPDIITVTPTNRSHCDPSVNGALTIRDFEIELNGNPREVEDFDFELLDENQAFFKLPDIIDPDSIAFTDLEIGTYYIVASPNTGTGLGCPSPPARAEVQDNRVYPTLALSSEANTACDLVNFPADGSITATASTGGGTASTYTWTLDSAGITIFGPVSDNTYTRTFTGRYPGVYTVNITDDDTQCTYSASIEVPDIKIYPDVITLAGSNQTFCDPVNATITINDNDVEINEVPQLLSDLYVELLEDDQTTVIEDTTVAAGQTTMVFDSLGFGTYYLRATRINAGTGAGCPSPPARLDLFDDRTYPSLLLSSTSNSVCDVNGFGGDGTITAEASTGGALASSYSWMIFDPNGTEIYNVTNDSDSITLIDLEPGEYSVVVIDDDTECSYTGSVEIPDNPIYPSVLDITPTPQTTCNDNGEITINDGDVLLDGDPQNVADLDFTLLDASRDPLPDTPEDNGTSKTFDSLAFGTYYVVVASDIDGKGAGCPTAPVRVDLEDDRIFPIASFDEPKPNTACDITLSNGSITVNAAEGDGNTTFDYDFVWTYEGGALPATAEQSPAQGTPSSTSTLDSIPEGDYQVQITNLTTGCVISAGYTIEINNVLSEPNIITVETTDPLDCNPSGSAEVTKINIGGGPGITDPVVLATDYEYEWYVDDPDVPANQLTDGLGNPITTPNVDSLAPGTYYVLIRSLITACVGNPKEVIINDDDIVYPQLALLEGPKQVSCDLTNPIAGLEGTVTEPDGQLSNYTFTWTYNGSTTLPSTVNITENTTATAGNPAFSRLDAAPDGTWELTALNNVSGCSVTKTYIIEDNSDLFPPRVSVASTDLFNCVLPDGTVSAGVIPYTAVDGYPYANTNNYRYDWYEGDVDVTTDNNPEYPNMQTVSGLTDGTYTIKVTDLNTTCIESKVVLIEDGRVVPDVEIIQDAPLTNCDPARFNGQLRAIVDGGLVSGYLFEWYNGTDTTGVPDYNINDIYTNLDIGAYTVVVTNESTLCETTESDEIEDARVYPPEPDPEVLRHRTSCIEPDGIVAASVNGNTIDYQFDWYNGSSVGNTPDHEEAKYYNLDINEYTVTATDLITGCVSDPSTVEVLDMRIFPEFDFNVVNASCEQEDGSLEITWLDNYSNIDEIHWTDANGVEVNQGPGLYNYAAGEYVATVNTFQGCEVMNTGVIGIDILTYNGVSPNGDNSNDNWQISCITLFPNNHIKIFNRNGVLVYQADGYDNGATSFIGVGERGTYLIGEELPDGTYFYIIDKGDGSVPKTGFLELLR